MIKATFADVDDSDNAAGEAPNAAGQAPSRSQFADSIESDEEEPRWQLLLQIPQWGPTI